MGVRPPPDDEEEPDAVTFGIAALDGRLDRADVSFPASTADIERALGDMDVPYDAAGNEMALSTALERVDSREFETRHEFLNALHPVFEEHRSRTSSTVLGQLRGLLPF